MIDRIHGGSCLKLGIIDFSVNTNPLGLPNGLLGILSKNTDCILRYPDPSSKRLKRELSILHGIGSENISVGNGSIELIYLIPRAFKIKKALIITPTFSEYEFSLISNGSTPVFLNTYEKENFIIDYGKLEKSLSRCDAFFLCNPDNPTGRLLHSDEVLYLSGLARKQNRLLILDEAFIEFTEQPKSAAVMEEAVKNGSLVILRSLTKCLSIPGLRLGYIVGHKKMIKKITKLQYPWNINGMAQLAGETALENKIHMERTRLFVAKEREYMLKRLRGIKGLKVYPPSANFILCKLQNASICSSIELRRRLLRDNIYIRACGNFRGLNDMFFRVAVKIRNDNDRLINSMEKVF